MRGKYINIKGIVTSIRNVKDADLIVNVVDIDGSKHTVYAKGVRKAKSRKAHALDLYNYVELKVSDKGELGFINEAKLINDFREAKDGYDKLILIQLVCEVANHFSQEDLYEPEYFTLLTEFPQLLGQGKDILLTASILIKLMQLSGFLPNLGIDIKNGSDISMEESKYLSSEVGYTLNSEFAFSDPISKRIYKSQMFILGSYIKECLRLDLTIQEQMRLLNIHTIWIEMITSRKLYSRDLISHLLK